MATLPVYSPTSIANRALRHVPDRPITDIADTTNLQARECNAAYADCVAELLEEHPWDFAFARQALVQVTNDRPDEWAYAYATPNDVAYLGKVFLPADVTNSGVVNDPGGVVAVVAQPRNYLGLSSTPSFIGDSTDWTDRAPGWRFMPYDQTVYTDCPPGVVAEYTTNSLPESRFGAQFTHALSLLLASRIAPFLTKDANRRTALLSEYELIVGRAKANDRNRQQETYGHNIPDWIAVRA